MIKNNVEELNQMFLEKLDFINSVEDYLVLKKQIEVLNDNYKDLLLLLDKRLLEVVIDVSIDTTLNNIDVDTYFLLQDIQEKKKQIKRIDKDYLENEEYIKLQFEEIQLQKEEYELF